MKNINHFIREDLQDEEISWLCRTNVNGDGVVIGTGWH
jgi:hypothetical protein